MDLDTCGIGIFAPSGHVTDDDALERAVAWLSAIAREVVVDATARTRSQRFSASDDERIAAFERMAADPRVDIAIAARGGYGLSRLLDRLDFARLAHSGTRWVGHSDFTAFELAALARSRMVSFAGPMACYDFGAETPSAFTTTQFVSAMRGDEHAVAFDADPHLDVHVEGTLWGGNLAIIASLIGTPYLPDVDGGVLFVEDVREHPYRIERMLLHLHWAGVLARQRVVLLGEFTEYALGANDGGYDIDAAIAHVARAAGVPFVRGLPFGHCRDKATLPIGAHCSVDVENGRANLAFAGAATFRA